MANWIGLLCLPVTLFMLVAAFRHRRAVLAERQAHPIEGEPAMHESLSLLADIMPPLVVLGLFIVAGEMILVYLMVGGPETFSLFDLGSSLSMMAAFGYWITTKTKYRRSLR